MDLNAKHWSINVCTLRQAKSCVFGLGFVKRNSTDKSKRQVLAQTRKKYNRYLFQVK